MTFQLTRKYLEEEIETSKVALQKHHEGVRVHELVIKAFEKELKTLPEDEEEIKKESKFKPQLANATKEGNVAVEF